MKFPLIFIFLIAISIQTSEPFFFDLLSLAKKFAMFLKDMIVQRSKYHLVTTIESLLFGDGENKLELFRKEILEKMESLTQELHLVSYNIINQLSWTLEANSKLVVVFQTLMDQIDLVRAVEQQIKQVCAYKGKLQNETVIKVLEKLVEQGGSSISIALNKINVMITHESDSYYEGFLPTFYNYLEMVTVKKHCGEITSPKHLFYDTFFTLLSTEMRAYTMMYGGYLLLGSYKNVNYSGELEMLNNTFTNHVVNITSTMFATLENLPEYTYNCPPVKYEKNVNYVELTPYLPSHIYTELEINRIYSCYGKCSDIAKPRIYRNYTALTRRSSKTCKNNLSNCKVVPEDENEPFCLRDRNDKKLYKKPDGKCHQYKMQSWMESFYYCEYCICECLTTDYNYVYAGEMKASKENYVVTGVRFTYMNATIFLQIQIGNITAFGLVDPLTVEWQPLNQTVNLNDKSLFLQMNETFKKISLADHRVNIPNVLVGVQLFKNELGMIDVKLFGQEIDIVKGVLKTDQATKVFHQKRHKNEYQEIKIFHKRPLVDLSKNEDLSVPTNIKKTLFVTFTKSSLRHDFEQSWIPFLDIRSVEPSVKLPLAGIGLYHRQNENYGGILEVRLIALNITQFFEKEIAFGNITLIE